jgi:hypothetical protein
LGGGGGGGGHNGDPTYFDGGNGGSGVVIIRFPDTYPNLTSIGGGLTYSLTTTGGYKIYKFTNGTGLITF